MIQMTKSFSYYQLKNLLKLCLNKMGLIYFRIFCFEFVCFNTVNKYITIYPILMQTYKFRLLLSKIYGIFLLQLVYLHLSCLLGLYKDFLYRSFYYQMHRWTQISAISHFYQTHYHLMTNNFQVNQIHYHSQNI